MHLMQASRFLTLATKPFISKTLVGQNSTQIWHPLQYFSMISMVGSFFSIHVAPLTDLPFQAGNKAAFIAHTVYRRQALVWQENMVLTVFLAKKGQGGDTSLPLVRHCQTLISWSRPVP